jgi:hypothetical protein
MKRRLLTTLGLIGLGVMAFGIDAATAQTTANGPYYATPSWDQKLQCDTPATCPRFVVLANWNNAAVLDRETGLVWEKAPPSTRSPDWETASFFCAELSLGGRQGWRLPTIQDLTSLVDPTQSNPALPSGHPFTVQFAHPADFYWSATPSPFGSTSALVLAFHNPDGIGIASKSLMAPFWCVRGGQGVGPQ